MDIDKLNEDFSKIGRIMVNQLDSMDYSDNPYDVEEELHDLEDALMEEFGEYLEDAIQEVYENLCPDNDVLIPKYIAKHYTTKQKEIKADIAMMWSQEIFPYRIR